jgi:hypothetical protein
MGDRRPVAAAMRRSQVAALQRIVVVVVEVPGLTGKIGCWQRAQIALPAATIGAYLVSPADALDRTFASSSS